MEDAEGLRAHKDQAAERTDGPAFDSQGGAGSQRRKIDMSLVISVLSLAVASLSAFFAYSLSKDAYESDRRSDLLAVMERLVGLSDDETLSEAEARDLIDQGRWLLTTVDDAPPAVYLRLGEAMLAETVYDDEALPLLEQAIESSLAQDDEYLAVAAARVKARVYLEQGKLEDMRWEYSRAVGFSDNYAGESPERRYTVPAFTHIFWGEAEAQAGHCARADEQVASARNYAEQKTGSNLDERLSSLESLIEWCRSNGASGTNG